MRASEFKPDDTREFSPAARVLFYALLYAVLVPLMRLFEAIGRWPGFNPPLPDFGDYSPAPSDVIACSYFKSGTTWLLQIATQIAFHGDAEFDNIHYAVAWPDVPPPIKHRVIPLSDPSPARLSPSGKRVIKTHLRLSQIPFVPEARYVVVVRDPKDVCVSGYHFLRSLFYGPMMASVGGWVDYFLSPRFAHGSWAAHLAGYWAVRDRPNVLFLTFGEMKADLPGTVRKIAQLMNVTLNEQQFESVVQKSGFAAMKAEAAKFEPGEMLPWSAKEGAMMRKGESGGSSELLTPEMEHRIDAQFRAELMQLNCDFPYDTTFDVVASRNRL